MSIDDVLRSPLWGIAGLAVALAGLFVAYIFYQRGQRKREPRWTIRSNNLISDNTARLASLEVTYSGEQVRNLTISRCVFWNAGGETIRRLDIAPTDPLRICALDDSRIMDVPAIVQANNEASQVHFDVADDRK